MSEKTFSFTSPFLFKLNKNNITKKNKSASSSCLREILHYQVYDLKLKPEFYFKSILMTV